MTYTVYETLTTLLAKSRSANTILYYIENKGWFDKYKTGFKQPDKYFSIPYQEWITKTLINRQHIRVLEALIFNNDGDIQYDEQTNRVDIWGSTLQPFISKMPREHMIHICKSKQKTLPLIKYLDEFYGYELRQYRYESYNIAYKIDYDEWLELFEMDATEILKTNKYIISGHFGVQYNDADEPSHVVIRIK